MTQRLTGFIQGYETGQFLTVSSFESVTGDCTIVTSPVHSGKYALRVHETNTQQAFTDPNTISSLGNQSCSFYWRAESFPAAERMVWAHQTSGLSNYPFVTYHPSDGKLYAYWNHNTGNEVIGPVVGPAVELNRWYHIESFVQQFDESPNGNNVFKWRVDEVDYPSLELDQVTAIFVGLWLGSFSPNEFGGSPSEHTYYYDDVVTYDASHEAPWPVGDPHIYVLRPNSVDLAASVGLTDFQLDDGGAVGAESSSRLTDDPHTDATTFIKQVNAVAGSFVQGTWGDLGLADGIVDGVHPYWAYHSLGALANDGSFEMVDPNPNVPDFEVHDGSMAGTSLKRDWNEDFNIFRAVNGFPWSVDEVDALGWRIGKSSDVIDVPCWDALLLQVAVRNPVGFGASDSNITIPDLRSASWQVVPFPRLRSFR